MEPVWNAAYVRLYMPGFYGIAGTPMMTMRCPSCGEPVELGADGVTFKHIIRGMGSRLRCSMTQRSCINAMWTRRRRGRDYTTGPRRRLIAGAFASRKSRPC